MLTVKEAIAQRRSIRSFRPDPIPDEHLDELIEAARLAPSGSNRQPWRFLVVKDPALRRQLRRIAFDQAFVEQAPVVIVCLADLRAYARPAVNRRYQEFVEYGVLETLSGRFADPAYWENLASIAEPDRPSILRRAVANTYIAIEHIVLMAAALGLGTCWVGAIGEEGQINALFDLDSALIPVALLPVGYPAQVPPPRPRLATEEITLPPRRPPPDTGSRRSRPGRG